MLFAALILWQQIILSRWEGEGYHPLPLTPTSFASRFWDPMTAEACERSRQEQQVHMDRVNLEVDAEMRAREGTPLHQMRDVFVCLPDTVLLNTPTPE